jgi:hypothetical protein
MFSFERESRTKVVVRDLKDAWLGLNSVNKTESVPHRDLVLNSSDIECESRNTVSLLDT